MKHRERVLMALDHKKTDRCPMQISFTPEFASKLKMEMNIDDNVHNPHGGGNTYQLERALDQDMLLVSVGWANSYYRVGYEDVDSYVDEWGIKWNIVDYSTKFGKGKYTEICGHPLADEEAIDNYKAPDPERPHLYKEAESTIKDYKDEYFIVGVTVTTIFETAWALRGLDNLLIDFIENPDLAEQILQIPYDYHLAAAKKLAEIGVDMIWLGDDIGAQNSMMVSPDLWRKFLKPKMATFIAELKNISPDIKVAYHSDGVIYPIIPDLIEIGLDVLNPIQPAAMDPMKIKRKYGDKLSFWGTIDEQYTLPFGKPEEVKEEVLKRLKTIGNNGGLILSPTHHVQLDTPIENFWAMVDTIRSYDKSKFLS